ncbi:MAG: AfsR/SARP family transcriptional regulator, partial [Gemmatirosa sp.]
MRSGDFRLLTLGRLALVDPTGVEDASLGTRRRKLALLALLATARRPVSRDALVELFWGEQSEERARHSLSDALSHLRRTLGPGSITARRAEVALADDAPLAVDVLALAAAADAGRWDEVVALYAGPFLDAVHVAGSPRWEQWVDQQRARVEAAFQSACRAECARLAAAGEWEACAALAARWLERAPLSAPAAVRRLTALAADGSADGARRALDAYERLGRLLR